MKILLIDLSSIFWQNWHSTKDLETNEAYHRTIDRIYKSSSGYDKSVICVDAPPYKRAEIYQQYKANREPPSTVATGQLKRVIKELTSHGLPVYKSEGYEADDIIATLVYKIDQYDEIETSVDILTGDKDLCQLVDSNTTVISTQKGDIIDREAVVEKFGVLPNMVGQLLALMGDKSDNIPGVSGVGIKTAAKIIKHFNGIERLLDVASNGDVDFELNFLGEVARQKIISSVDDIEVSLRLVTLMNDAPIDVERIFGDTEVTEVEIVNEVAPVEKTEEKITSIVKHDGNWIRQLEPGDSMSAWKLSNILWESRLYTKFMNPQSILAVILRGRELGLGATTALEEFHVVEGKPTMGAHLITGLVMRSSVCKFFKCVESTEKNATYKTLRSDDPDNEPTILSFTIEQADKRGLLKPSRSGRPTQWQKMPEVMLRWRCATSLARMVYPDVVGGLYTPDEIEYSG